MDDWISKGTKSYNGEAISYLKKSSLEEGHHPSRHDHEAPEAKRFDFEIT